MQIPDRGKEGPNLLLIVPKVNSRLDPFVLLCNAENYLGII
jgi:hypothetical protein